VHTYVGVFGYSSVYTSFLKGRNVHTQDSIVTGAYRSVQFNAGEVSSTCYFPGKVIWS
jgi:hypothetical protein